MLGGRIPGLLPILGIGTIPVPLPDESVVSIATLGLIDFCSDERDVKVCCCLGYTSTRTRFDLH